MSRVLPVDSEARKGVPLFRGLMRYFPAALAGVAIISRIGNDKHNPGQEMHHARGKSTDHADCIMRHLMDLDEATAELDRSTGAMSPVELEAHKNLILSEVRQMAWRALALAQQVHEDFGAPLAPGAKLPEPPAAQELGQFTAQPTYVGHFQSIKIDTSKRKPRKLHRARKHKS